jgi:hypothetical protein
VWVCRWITYECYARLLVWSVDGYIRMLCAFVRAEIGAHIWRDRDRQLGHACRGGHLCVTASPDCIRYRRCMLRARMRSVGSRDAAAVSTADVCADPPRRYRPCAQLHMRAVRICARARLRVDSKLCVFARCAIVLTRACVRPVCLRVCMHACKCVQVRACVSVCGPSRGTAGTGGIYRSARRWPCVHFAFESSVGPQVRRGRAVR